MNYSAFHWAEKARKYAETIGTIFNVKGRVNTVADLPISGNKVGDLYLVGLSTDADLTEYAWLSFDGTTRWERLGYTSITNSFSALTGSPYDNASLATALNGKQATISDLAAIRSGASAGATALQPSALNGYATESWVNNKGYITGVTSAMVTTALGYTPVNPTALATVATSGSYNDLSNKPTIPTVNNPTITLTQGGTTKGSFTLNQSSGATIDLDAGGSVKTHDLFDNKWTDHLLNDQSWLRADTFSWQDGTVYSDAYNHLVVDYSEYSGVTGISDGSHIYEKDDSANIVDGETTYYAWTYSGMSVYTTTENPTVGSYTVDAPGVITLDIEIIEVIDGLQTETIGSYTITYYLATDGHKICLPDQETTVANIYNESGVAWYYILDTTNQRFKLPRTKWGFVGLRDSVGKYVAAGLPNITGSFSNTPSNTNAYSGAFRRGGNGQTFGNGNDQRGSDTSFDASRSNPIYGSSTTVQPPATQMYLYFYVGQFSQTATEQTAGLNSELFNGKMDRDMSNMNASQTAKDIVMGWGMPDYSAVITGISFPYTAPSNGIISFNIDNYGLYLTINSTRINVGGNDSGNEGPVQLPLSKGDVIQSSTTYYHNLIFIPLKGV